MTSTRVQVRRDTATNIAAAVPAEGEIGYDTTNKRLVVGDGAETGGIHVPSFKDVQNRKYDAAVAGGTADAITISTAKNPSSLAALQGVKIKIATTNTGAVTLQWGGLPATAVKKYSGTSKVDLSGGNLIAGKIYYFDFDGTDFVLFSEGGSGVPAGVVSDFAGSSAPTGWLMCYGQAVSRTTYADLYAAIGVTFGSGDGTSTFNLPDCRGRISAGKDDMGGTSANRLTGLTGGVNGDGLGNTGGAEAVTLSTSEMPSHSHNFFYYGTGSTGTSRPNGTNSSTVVAGSLATSSSGGGGSHNNVQPTIIFNKIIKT